MALEFSRGAGKLFSWCYLLTATSAYQGHAEAQFSLGVRKEYGVEPYERDYAVVTYVVSHEVWWKKFAKGETPASPSKSPDRLEAVMIQAHNVMTSQTRLFRIDRPKGKPRLTPMSEWGDQPQPGGTWDNLLMDPSAVQ